jgi:RNA polymerase sigma-70 factor (ECF subfamily)
MKEGKDLPKSEPSDWLAAAQGGDAEAYRKFLDWAKVFVKSNVSKRYRSWGMASVESIDDLVQDVLLALHQKRHTYEPGKPVEAWVYAIVRYKAIDALRRTVRDRRKVSDQDMPEGWEAVDPASLEVAGAATTIDVEVALGSLNPRQAEMVRMAKLEGNSIEEISKRTGSSQAAVKVTIHRALKALKRRFGTEEDPDATD